METRRLIIAVVLSVAVIILYQYFFVKPLPKPQIAVNQTANSTPIPITPAEEGKKPAIDMNMLQNEATAESKPKAQLPPVAADILDNIEKTISVETDLYLAVFTNKGVGLKSFVLKRYLDDEKKPLDLVSNKCKQAGIYPPFYYSPFSKNEIVKLNTKNFFYSGKNDILLKGQETITIEFNYANVTENISARKSFTFTNGTYTIGLENSVALAGKVIDQIPVVFGPDLENMNEKDKPASQPLKIVGFTGSDLKSTIFKSLPTSSISEQNYQINRGSPSNGYVWAAYETKYFAAIFRTDFHSEMSYLVYRFPKNDKTTDDYNYLIAHNPTFIYLGPKDEKILATIEEKFPVANKVIEYGWFGSIAKILLKGINLVYRVIPNYGWAIIIFTLLLKIILFPLTYSSSISMAKMATLQPKIKAIRKKYKNMRDPEQRRQMNIEVMNLYKQEKVNPAGGCLPLLLQLPILWGFFRLLDVAIDFRHQSWAFWITDLSKKDPIYLLPIFMTITQIIIQRMTPSGGDETQKKLMYFMPILMLLIFMNLASGLNLYFAFSNILQIGQQKIINDRIFKKKKEQDKERKIFRRKKGA